MRRCCNSIPALLAAIFLCCSAFADEQPGPPPALPADSLVMKCTRALVWDANATSVAELHGPVDLQLDHTKMSAEGAVVWISPNPGGATDSHKVEISLIGHAKLQQQGVLRLDQRLLVKAIVGGSIQIVGDRVSQSDESSPLFLDAIALRNGRPAPEGFIATTAPTTTPTTIPVLIEPAAFDGSLAPLAPLAGTTQPVTAPSPYATLPTAKPPTTGRSHAVQLPVNRVISFDGNYQRAVSSDGSVAAVCTDGVTLRYEDEKQNLLEFVAHDMVLFTNLKGLKGAGTGEDAKHFIADHLIAAYFDGDVQVYVTPQDGSKPELRMRAERVYYEFGTDRAIMTDVLFHTIDLKKNIPIFMRADKLRQLSLEEFNMQNVTITSSAFTTPTFNLQAGQAYVRAVDTGDPAVGEQLTYAAHDATLQAFGLPIFYFPAISGTMSSKGNALRTIDFNDDSDFGYGLRTRWGLFETLGLVPKKDLDTTYTLDYLSDRGFAGGLDSVYKGGFVSDTTKQPWNFEGDFHSYFVADDKGIDQLGALRSEESPEQNFRGRAYLEHQHFFPDDWQLQLRLGYVSDSNFMAQWFNPEYENNLPIDESIYLKHSHESETFSFLAEAQPNRAISTADQEQENREISRLPEVTYYRVGDSLAGDHLSFFSENSASGLKFVRNTQSLSEQGFNGPVTAGIPAFAYTGDSGATTYRGDFRQELDYPINAGPLRVVPYVFGRYTGYSQGVVPPKLAPQLRSIPVATEVASNQQRAMAGVGARVTTDFWKVDDAVQSDVFDLHRLRHIIEPELNVFASASNVDQNRLFIYDPNVDATNDVQAVQLALRQRWQTKRGGPGRWRSVDFFTLNLYANIFGNQPQNRFRDPTDFRGLFFYGAPETSIARNSANADATWRISDSTAVLGDIVQNLDKVRLATASVGVAVQRDTRLSYYLGTRYIADLDSNIITVEINYQLDRKYSLSASQSVDLSQNKDVNYNFSLTRNFDIFSAVARFYFDQATNNKGFSINIQPFGAKGLGSDQVATDATAQQQ